MSDYTLTTRLAVRDVRPEVLDVSSFGDFPPQFVKGRLSVVLVNHAGVTVTVDDWKGGIVDIGDVFTFELTARS